MYKNRTPVEKICGIGISDLKNLNSYHIKTIESLLCLTNTNSRKGVQTLLNFSDDDFKNFINKASCSLPPTGKYSLLIPVRSDRKYPFGAEKSSQVEDAQNKHLATAATVFNSLPPDVNLLPFMTSVKDQGDRGTCVAFSVASAREALEKIKTGNTRLKIDLSEQCLYYLCKQKDGIPNKDGTYVEIALGILRDNGVCVKNAWPYNKVFIPHNISHDPTPVNCKPYPCSNIVHKNYKVASFKALSSNSEIKECLLNKSPIIIVMEVYASWDDNGDVEETGILNNPIPNDELRGLHAVCLVGYDDKEKVFMFKNSWGTRWAFNSPYKPGYGQLSYDYVERYCHDKYNMVL